MNYICWTRPNCIFWSVFPALFGIDFAFSPLSTRNNPQPSFFADGVLALCMFVEILQQKMVVCASSRYQKINSTKLKCRNLSRIAIPHKSHVENSTQKLVWNFISCGILVRNPRKNSTRNHDLWKTEFHN